MTISTTSQEKEWRAWLYAGLWTLVVFLTVPLARTIQKLVTEHCGGKQAFTWIAIGGIVAGGLGMIVKMARRKERGTWVNVCWLLAIGAVFVYRAVQLRDAPVEAIHFLEYAFLGMLLFKALLFRIKDPLVYAAAIAVGATIGMADETIQWITPHRIWDWRDVWFNGSSVCLMQAAIAFGFNPLTNYAKIRPSSVQCVCRLCAMLVIMCGLCFSNTPARMAWYAVRVPGLGFLERNESIMTEYGHMRSDPDIGKFKSRFSEGDLKEEDLKRGKEAAEILDRYRVATLYKDCLKDYPPHVDPLVHEARVHLRSMFHHLGILWPTNWDAPMTANMKQEQQKIHCTRAYKEYLIISRYYPVTYSNSHYTPRESQISAIRKMADENNPFMSKAGKEIITIMTENQLRAILLALLFTFIGIDLWVRHNHMLRHNHDRKNISC